MRLRISKILRRKQGDSCLYCGSISPPSTHVSEKDCTGSTSRTNSHSDERAPLLRDLTGTFIDAEPENILLTHTSEINYNGSTQEARPSEQRSEGEDIATDGLPDIDAPVKASQADGTAEEFSIFVKRFAPPRKKRHWIRDKILSSSIDTPHKREKSDTVRSRQTLRRLLKGIGNSRKKTTQALKPRHTEPEQPEPRLRPRVTFTPAVSIQTFDVDASPESAKQAALQTTEPLSDKICARTSYRSARARNQTCHNDTLDIRFLISTAATEAPRREFLEGVATVMRLNPSYGSLMRGVQKWQILQVEDGKTTIKRSPDLLRFRLTQIDAKTGELRDYSKQFTRIGGLRKWMHFDLPPVRQGLQAGGELDRKACASSMGLDVEYARFMSAYKMAKKDVREDAVREARDRDRWRRAMLVKTEVQDLGGEELRMAMAARKVQPMLELLWIEKKPFLEGFDAGGGGDGD